MPAPVTGGAFGPAHVNVADQRKDPDSLLNFVATLARRYRESPEVGMGATEVLDHGVASVLAHRCTWARPGDAAASTLLVHNLSPEATEITVTLAGVEEGTETRELFTDARLTVGRGGRLTVPVDGYGHLWWRLHQPGDLRLP